MWIQRVTRFVKPHFRHSFMKPSANPSCLPYVSFIIADAHK